MNGPWFGTPAMRSRVGPGFRPAGLHEESSTAARFPRVLVAGLSGDAGKTVVSLGLTLALRARGVDVRVFKKGPDYIDAAWLEWAAGRAARNLDTWMAGTEQVRGSFGRHATPDGFNVVEGNRGVFDGVDADGSHSTAALARLIGAPVLLVLDARKATRTLAACVLGCQAFDPELVIGGVILNRVSGSRHEAVAREAVEGRCGVPVIGVIPRIEGKPPLPGRHLGLLPPGEHPSVVEARETLLAAASHIDLEGVLAVGRHVPPFEPPPADAVLSALHGTATSHAASPPSDFAQGVGSLRRTTGRAAPDSRSTDMPDAGVVIGYLRDSAFTFYYPDNLEALQAAGARLVPISSLERTPLPGVLDALYIGGGFPETHAASLAANRQLLDSIACAARSGLPVYAECGGLMLLASGLRWNGARHEMSGVLPFDVEVHARPQGHGYARLLVDRPNGFFPPGTVLNGHEFHYSRLVDSPAATDALQHACCRVQRGAGCGAGRDAITAGGVWASYTHLHALGTPQWAPAVVRAAARFRAASGTAEPGNGDRRM